MYTISANDYVACTLTKAGAKELNDKKAALYKDYPRLGAFTPHKEGDYYKTQLWELLNDFGEHCYCSMFLPFTNFYIVINYYDIPKGCCYGPIAD